MPTALGAGPAVQGSLPSQPGQALRKVVASQALDGRALGVWPFKVSSGRDKCPDPAGYLQRKRGRAVVMERPEWRPLARVFRNFRIFFAKCKVNAG